MLDKQTKCFLLIIFVVDAFLNTLLIIKINSLKLQNFTSMLLLIKVKAELMHLSKRFYYC